MPPTRRKLLGVTAASLAVTGCLSGGTGDGEADDAASATVNVRSHAEYDDILVDVEGMTLYRFDADTKGNGQSACTDSCADAWPALTVSGEPTAGSAVDAILTTFDRTDGATQVAADGWPLYYFASDDEPGDAGGQGVNDAWWVVGPDGAKITAAKTSNEPGY